jgi:hypothetical protein
MTIDKAKLPAARYRRSYAVSGRPGRGRIHQHDLPDIATGVLDAAVVHEPWFCAVLGSALPPAATARVNVASTASRLSTLNASSA